MPQIYGYALSGVERCGAARSGYTSPKIFVSVNGVQVATARPVAANKVLVGSLSITEVLNQIPNTCAFTLMGTEPTEGQDVVITIGSINNLDRLFAGTMLNRAHQYVEKPANWQAPINAVDYTWPLTRRRFSGLFTNAAPAVIAAAIVAAVPGFTVAVAAGLAPIDVISFEDLDCLAALTRLATRIGGDCDVDYRKVVKLFVTDASVTNPTDLTAAHASLSAFAFTRDLSQVRTRIFVEGGGVAALAACAAGETILPVETTAWYNPVGGTVKSGPQHLIYTGLQAGGSGTFAGPGVTPSAALSPVLAAGAGIESGTHVYAFTWVTGLGESLPCPIATLSVGNFAPVDTPAIAPYRFVSSAKTTIGATYRYKYTIIDSYGETLPSPASNAVVAADNGLGFAQSLGENGGTFRSVVSVGGTYYSVRWYRSVNGGTYRYLDVAGTVDFNWSDADIAGAAAAPVVSTAASNQVALAGIALGPTGTTSRQLYRSAAGAVQLKLLATVANNTATTATDAAADATLGANVPTADTSGLTLTPGLASTFDTTVSGFPTDGAATNATTATPSFTSVSYTFVAGDVGASVYIKSGTNWTPGKYLITAVAAGAATLQGAVATVASPTVGTWGVDYTSLATPRVTFTDLVIDASPNQSRGTSAASPSGKNYVGNSLIVTSGLGFTFQIVTITSSVGAFITCDKLLGTGTSTGGHATLGGVASGVAGALTLPGSTTLQLASAAAFAATGGWALVGGQGLRYTGIAGNTLTGIPGAGAGSILAAIPTGVTVTAAAALTGVPASGAGAVVYPLLQGDPINLLVRVDDVSAQSALAALIGGGDDGVVEEYLQDGTIGETEARARGAAQLARSSRVLVSLTYTTRDRNTHAGRTIHVNLGSPTNLTGDFQIQHVTIDRFDTALLPTYTVQASSDRFSLDDLLRLARAA